MVSDSLDRSWTGSPWRTVGWCTIVGLATALVFNLVAHTIFVRISPDYYRLSPFPGLHTRDVRFDAFIEGLVTGLWQGLVIGLASGLAVVRTQARYSIPLAVKVIIGGFVIAGAFEVLLGPAMMLNNLQIGIGPKTPGFDLLSDSAQTPFCVVAYLVRIENPFAMLAAMVPGAVVLLSMDKSVMSSMRSQRPRQRPRSAAELRSRKRWVIAFLLAQLAPCLVAAIGIYYPLMPIWIPRAAFGVYLAGIIFACNGMLDSKSGASLQPDQAVPIPESHSESSRPRVAAYLSISIWIASVAFALAVALAGMNNAVSQTAMLTASALLFGKIILLAVIDVRASRNARFNPRS